MNLTRRAVMCCTVTVAAIPRGAKCDLFNCFANDLQPCVGARQHIDKKEQREASMNVYRLVAKIAVFGALLLFVGLSPDRGFPQAPFYQGKTITVIAGTSPGGIGDNRVKSMVPFLRKYIPGNPAIVVEYMDGGGGRQVGNHMYRNARPDGLTVGAFSSAVVSL